MVDSTDMQTGRYKAYPEYKDSGVEWIGKIPRDWSILSLKRCVDGVTNGIWGTEPNGHHDLVVLRVADFDRNRLVVSDEKLTYRSITKKEAESRLLTKGDLLIEKSGGGDKTLVGCVVLFDKDYPAVTSNFVAKMTPNEGYSSRFLLYAFSLLYDGRVNFSSIKQTTGIQNLDSDAYLMEKFCFPIKANQEKIANFLDYETAKIDTLIEKQQRLIELLTEKRQAVISHAVTKGLNPDVPMKDSGVEWLGKVPAHWEITRIKHVVNTFEQGWSPQCDSRPADKDEYGVLKVGAVNYGEFRADENKALPPELTPRKQYQIKKDDLLISRANTKELVGSAAIVGKDYPQLLLCDKLYRLRLNANALPSLIALYLSIAPVRGQIELQASGASHSMQNISQDVIKELPCLIPPLDEAQKLVENINGRLEVFNQITRKSQQQIQLMQERRTALISAAVTGKIDMRDWVKPE